MIERQLVAITERDAAVADDIDAIEKRVDELPLRVTTELLERIALRQREAERETPAMESQSPRRQSVEQWTERPGTGDKND